MGPDTARPGERREWLPNSPTRVIPGRTFLPCWCREASCTGVFLIEPERVQDLFAEALRRGFAVRWTPGDGDVQRSEAIRPMLTSYGYVSPEGRRAYALARRAPRPPLVGLRTIHPRRLAG